MANKELLTSYGKEQKRLLKARGAYEAYKVNIKEHSTSHNKTLTEKLNKSLISAFVWIGTPQDQHQQYYWMDMCREFDELLEPFQ